MEQAAFPGIPSPADLCSPPHDRDAADQDAHERTGEACATHFVQAGAQVVVLRGVWDWRTEELARVLIDQSRSSGRHLVVDLSAVTHLHIDVLAQLLAARRHPGVSLVGPLPPAFLRITDATGTAGSFTVHADVVTAAAAALPHSPDH